MTRRTTLRALLGAGGAAFVVPAWSETVEAADTLACVATTPTVTEGPYWVDEKLFRPDIRTDPGTGTARAGIPLTLTVNVQNLAGGACQVNTSGQKFLRGYQITDANGQVQFTTIYPGWYMGRTIHIHFRVRTYNGATVLSNFVSQIFFDETVNNLVLGQSAYSRTAGRGTTNANDMVYRVAIRSGCWRR